MSWKREKTWEVNEGSGSKCTRCRRVCFQSYSHAKGPRRRLETILGRGFSSYIQAWAIVDLPSLLTFIAVDEEVARWLIRVAEAQGHKTWQIGIERHEIKQQHKTQQARN